MEQKYSRISEENLSESDEVTTRLLFEKDRSQNLFKYRQNYWIKLHITLLYALIATLSVLLGSIWFKHSPPRDLGTLYTPARQMVEYYQHRFTWNFWDKGEYMGFPTDEVDQRWSDLYNFGTSGIPSTEANLLDDKTVVVPGDESRSLVMLSVWHQIHCLNIVRKAVYRERWPEMWKKHENGSVNFDTEEMYHIDHCIDHIRQALMCFGDVSPTSFFFDPKRGNKPVTEGLHMCRRYDNIKDWAVERQVFYFSRDNETLGNVIGEE